MFLSSPWSSVSGSGSSILSNALLQGAHSTKAQHDFWYAYKVSVLDKNNLINYLRLGKFRRQQTTVSKQQVVPKHDWSVTYSSDFYVNYIHDTYTASLKLI